MPSVNINFGDAAYAGAQFSVLLNEFLTKHQIVAAIVCILNCDAELVDVTYAFGVPCATLLGAERTHVELVLNDCFKHPVAHSHGVSHLALPNRIKRLNGNLHGLNRVWFVPIKVGERPYIVLAFPDQHLQSTNPPIPFIQGLYLHLKAMDDAYDSARLRDYLAVMERFVKEVGHDIASSVQSTLAKVRNISQGITPTEFVPIRAKDVEHEIMSAYRVAEGLGVVVDSTYQIKRFEDFDAVDRLEAAIKHHTSEAEERHVQFSLKCPFSEIPLVGDRLAFEQMLGHLFSNAIKYAFGNSIVEISVQQKGDHYCFCIKNIGIPLPKGEAGKKIWDFGFRGGEDAKGRHVNGSGIGLYTVKKIVMAHHGLVSCGHSASDKLTWFEISIPSARSLRHSRPDLFVDAIASGRR